MRKIWEIANEIKKDWKKPYYGAKPYLDAMQRLEDLHSYYGLDSAYSIINYFLVNTLTWRGETARRIKKELKEMLINHREGGLK